MVWKGGRLGDFCQCYLVKWTNQFKLVLLRIFFCAFLFPLAIGGIYERSQEKETDTDIIWSDMLMDLMDSLPFHLCVHINCSIEVSILREFPTSHSFPWHQVMASAASPWGCIESLRSTGWWIHLGQGTASNVSTLLSGWFMVSICINSHFLQMGNMCVLRTLQIDFECLSWLFQKQFL